MAVIRGAVFDPVRHDDAENVEGEFDGDELAARGVASGFGGPDGGDGVEDAGADAVEGTGAEHPFGVLGGALKSGTDDGPQGGYGDGLDSTIAVTKPASKEGAKESSGKVVHGNLESQIADQPFKLKKYMWTGFQGHAQCLLAGVASESRLSRSHHQIHRSP